MRLSRAALCMAGAYALALSASERLFCAHRELLVRIYAALGRVCALSSAPVAEALALSLALGSACAAVGALIASLRRRSWRPIIRLMAGLMALTLGLGSVLALMWPAWRRDTARVQPAYLRAYSLSQLEELILSLDGVLRRAEQGVNLSGPTMRLSTSPEALAERAARAYRAAGYDAQAPKLARLPGWMELARIAGIFVPITGEAVVDGRDMDSALPYTMLHELAHAQGVLREDEANLLALEVALGSGDAELVWSSALTALRYALGTLRALAPARYAALRGRLSPPALRELDAQRAFERAPRGHDALLSAAGAGLSVPALASADGAFVRVSGQGEYDGLTYLLLDASWADILYAYE